MWWVLIQWEGCANCSGSLEQAYSTVWATVKKGYTCAKPWRTKKRVHRYSKQKEEHMLFGVTVQWWEWLEFETITVFLVLKTNTCFAYLNHITHINSDLIYDFPLAPYSTRLSQCPLAPKLPSRQSLLDISWPPLLVLVSGHLHLWPQCPKLFLQQPRANFSSPWAVAQIISLCLFSLTSLSSLSLWVRFCPAVC